MLRQTRVRASAALPLCLLCLLIQVLAPSCVNGHMETGATTSHSVSGSEAAHLVTNPPTLMDCCIWWAGSPDIHFLFSLYRYLEVMVIVCCCSRHCFHRQTSMHGGLTGQVVLQQGGNLFFKTHHMIFRCFKINYK